MLDVPGEVRAGEPCDVVYHNPEMAGQTVVVDVDNTEGDVQQVLIHLDENGHGCGNFVCPPEWEFAKFNAPSASEVTKSVSLQ